MPKTFTFPCRDCENGYVTVGRRGANDPDTYEAECDTCHGSNEIELEAQDAFNEAISRLTTARTLFHLNFRFNRLLGWKYHEEASRWLRVAREVDSIIAEQDHAGAGHIGREAA
jgi:hypothetical protein